MCRALARPCSWENKIMTARTNSFSNYSVSDLSRFTCWINAFYREPSNAVSSYWMTLSWRNKKRHARHARCRFTRAPAGKTALSHGRGYPRRSGWSDSSWSGYVWLCPSDTTRSAWRSLHFWRVSQNQPQQSPWIDGQNPRCSMTRNVCEWALHTWISSTSHACRWTLRTNTSLDAQYRVSDASLWPCSWGNTGRRIWEVSNRLLAELQGIALLRFFNKSLYLDFMKNTLRVWSELSSLNSFISIYFSIFIRFWQYSRSE